MGEGRFREDFDEMSNVSGRMSAISDETAADLERWRAAASQWRLDISDVRPATPGADLRM